MQGELVHTDKVLERSGTRFSFQVNNQAFALPSKCLILTFSNKRTSDSVDHCFCDCAWFIDPESLWQILWCEIHCFPKKALNSLYKVNVTPSPNKLLQNCSLFALFRVHLAFWWTASESFVLLCYSMLSCTPTWWEQMYLLLLLQKCLAGFWDLKWLIIYQITDVFTDLPLGVKAQACHTKDDD